VEIVLYMLGVAAMLIGIAGVVLPALPGSLLIMIGVVLVAWAEGFTRVGWGTVAVVTVLCVGIWVVDLAAATLGARMFGASRWAVVGAAVGLLVGMFLGLPGLVLGPVLGAMAFELVRNPDVKRAARAGVGAFLGFVLGSVVKVALAFTAVGIVVAALVW
jgi:uncharacterized protein YqgC (DUF456 family)